MKVFVVLAYDDYYPAGDNIKRIYAREEDVPSLSELLKVWKGWKNVEVVEKELL